MQGELRFYTKDHPEANGRIPKDGENAYEFIFPLADGTSLRIHCGDETMLKFQEFLGSMQLDTA
jgi:hypothetical protein